jgi:hypothetical protein
LSVISCQLPFLSLQLSAAIRGAEASREVENFAEIKKNETVKL